MNNNVDYDLMAELYPGPRLRRGAISYHRFDSLAHAVQFAVEELNPLSLSGAFIEVDEVRYGSDEIRELYDSDAYPLQRHSVRQRKSPPLEPGAT